MNTRFIRSLATWSAAVAALAASLHAAIPAAPQLLPADTIAFITTSDWTKANAAWKANNLGRLWNDPAMRPFRENFEKRFQEEVVGKLEKQLGIRLADYLAVAQGQITLAAIRADWQPNTESTPPWLLILDSADKSPALKSLLDDTLKKLRTANRTVSSQKIRDTEFFTVAIDPSELDKLSGGSSPKPGAKPADKDDDDDDDAPPGKKPAKAPRKIELTFGQSGSALLVTSSPKTLDRVVARLTGGSIDPLDSQDRFQNIRQSILRDGIVQSWIDVTPFTALLTDLAGGPTAMLGIDPRKAVVALGLDATQWGAFSLQESPEGTVVHSALGVPAERRTGIYKMIQGEAKDSAPPNFVPADAVKFHRWRLDGQKSWKALEDALTKVSPQILGMLRLGLDSAGQQDDPNFTFKSEFVDRLGDDIITFEKAPKGKTLPELNNPPSLLLIGSPKPERLVNGLRAMMLMGTMQSGAGGIEVRDFLGRKIYSAKLGAAGRGNSRTHMSAGAGYVAISSDVALVEEYLRSTEGTAKSLKDFPGLSAAVGRIGGLSTGFFMFENQLEASRASWELLRQGRSLDRIMPPGTANLDTARAIEEWADFSLLPDFDKISRYFTFGVLTGSADPQAFHLKWFAPAARP